MKENGAGRNVMIERIWRTQCLGHHQATHQGMLMQIDRRAPTSNPHVPNALNGMQCTVAAEEAHIVCDMCPRIVDDDRVRARHEFWKCHVLDPSPVRWREVLHAPMRRVDCNVIRHQHRCVLQRIRELLRVVDADIERVPLEVPAPIARFEACELRLDLGRVGVKNRVVALIRDWTLGVWTAENRCIEFRRGWNVGARIEDDLEHILAELAKRT